MKFSTWLKNQKDRNDKVGDLSRDFLSTKHNSPGDTLDDWMLYLEIQGACQAALDSCVKAYEEYERT